MGKKEKQQFSFSTYEAYKKIKKNDPLKILYDSIDWSFIEPKIKERYYSKKELIYTPVSLFKAQLLLYLGKARSNRDLAEKLRFNSKYCLLCGFHHFLKTPSHSTFSAFKKRVGKDLFHKIMHRIVAQGTPIIIDKLPDISPAHIHINAYSKEGKLIKCNCKGNCKFSNILEDNQNHNKKFFVSSGYKIKLLINKDSNKPFAAEIKPKL